MSCFLRDAPPPDPATLPLPLPGDSGLVGLLGRRVGLEPELALPLMIIAVDLHFS